MAGNNGPKIVNSGLVMMFDAAAANARSGTGINTLFKDLSGNGYDFGVAQSSNLPTFVNSNGGSFQFDGTSDYFVRSTTSPKINSANVTYEAWFSITVLNSGLRGVIFTKKNNTKSLLTIERNTTNGLISQIGAVNTSPISMTILNTVSIAWYCVSCTVNGTLATGYLNGSQVNTANLAAALDTSDDYMGIGASVLTTSSYHTGLISSIKFYNRALSATEIRQNFDATRGRFGI